MKLVLSAFAVLLLSSCSSVPPYKKFGFGGGYKDKEIEPDKFSIYYAGNGPASVEGVLQMWHRRASELCGGREYSHTIYDKGRNPYEVHLSSTPARMSFPEVTGVVHCLGNKADINTPSNE